MGKERLHHKVDPLIIDDQHRSEYDRGISSWATNPVTLITVVEPFRNFKEILNLMDYCRQPTGRGAR